MSSGASGHLVCDGLSRCSGIDNAMQRKLVLGSACISLHAFGSFAAGKMRSCNRIGSGEVWRSKLNSPNSSDSSCMIFRAFGRSTTWVLMNHSRTDNDVLVASDPDLIGMFLHVFELLKASPTSRHRSCKLYEPLLGIFRKRNPGSIEDI